MTLTCTRCVAPLSWQIYLRGMQTRDLKIALQLSIKCQHDFQTMQTEYYVFGSILVKFKYILWYVPMFRKGRSTIHSECREQLCDTPTNTRVPQQLPGSAVTCQSAARDQCQTARHWGTTSRLLQPATHRPTRLEKLGRSSCRYCSIEVNTVETSETYKYVSKLSVTDLLHEILDHKT